MDTRNAHWKQSWKIPHTSWKVRGYSRAAYRTGFYIEELNILLDAGGQCYNNAKNIFVTHTHGDHIASLPFSLINPDFNSKEFVKPIIYGPAQAKEYIKNYITALFTTNAMCDSESLINQVTETYEYKGYDQQTVDRINIKNTDYDMNIFICDHGIPTISYGFTSISNKLKKEFIGKPGIEIKKLRQSGVKITDEVPTKKFAYICDTSIKILEMHPDILDYPVVFIECTFLYHDELENAAKTKHIHWYQLRDYVRKYTNTIFVLIHFSLRYSDEEILEFFAKEMGLYDISNIKVWAGDTEKELEPIAVDPIDKLNLQISEFVNQIITDATHNLF
jgi:ribonuclease Z